MENRREHLEKIMAIVKRADEMGLLMFDRLSLSMDLDATYEDCGLRLDDLLNANDIDFCHDICGIQNNMNRRTAKLENCFLPRYS